jgi:hypothetical protein
MSLRRSIFIIHFGKQVSSTSLSCLLVSFLGDDLSAFLLKFELFSMGERETRPLSGKNSFNVRQQVFKEHNVMSGPGKAVGPSPGTTTLVTYYMLQGPSVAHWISEAGS